MKARSERGSGSARRTRIARRTYRHLVALAAWGVAAPSLAWVYPEHRDIAVHAVESLDQEHAVALAELWSEARAEHEQRLCLSAADADQDETPPCIDWSALPGIAGDHSCSSREMT